MAHKRLERRILADLDAKKNELVALTSDLIRARSENPPGDTSEVAMLIERYLDDAGIRYDSFEPAEGHINILAQIGEGEDDLILCGHIDTVPAGDLRRWSLDPFSGKVVGGRIYGRGSTDMKGGVAAMLVAFKALSSFESSLDRRICLALFCDEETGGEFGVKSVLEKRLIRGECILIGEPSNWRRSGHVIVAGEKGALWIRMIFKGSAGHGSLPMLGENAVFKAVDILNKIRRLKLPKVRISHDARGIVSAGKRLLKVEYEDLGSPPAYNALEYYTINLGRIGGGVKTNIVADRCEIELDLRIPIGGRRREIEEIIDTIKGDAEVEYFHYAPPSYTAANSKLISLVKRASKKIFKEASPTICIPATSDGYFFRSELSTPVVSFGPGFVENAHHYNEWADLSDILGCAKIYALLTLWTSC